MAFEKLLVYLLVPPPLQLKTWISSTPLSRARRNKDAPEAEPGSRHRFAVGFGLSAALQMVRLQLVLGRGESAKPLRSAGRLLTRKPASSAPFAERAAGLKGPGRVQTSACPLGLLDGFGRSPSLQGDAAAG